MLFVAPTDLRPPRGLPARSPSAPRASLGASARSPARPRRPRGGLQSVGVPVCCPARPRRRPRVPQPGPVGQLGRLSETPVAFAGAGRASIETVVAFVGAKWAFLVHFSVAVVLPVSMVACWGRAVVPAVSCWPASVAAEVLLVSKLARGRVLCAKKFALLGLVRVRARKSSPSARKMAQNPRFLACWASFFAEMPLEGVCWASFFAEMPMVGVCWGVTAGRDPVGSRPVSQARITSGPPHTRTRRARVELEPRSLLRRIRGSGVAHALGNRVGDRRGDDLGTHESRE